MGVVAKGPGTWLTGAIIQLFCRHDWELVADTNTAKADSNVRMPSAGGCRIQKYCCRKCGAVDIKREPTAG